MTLSQERWEIKETNKKFILDSVHIVRYNPSPKGRNHMENEQEIKFYSVAEVSKMLGISRSRAYEWIISPQCPFLVLRIGRRIIIPANNFAKWYESFADCATEEK